MEVLARTGRLSLTRCHGVRGSLFIQTVADRRWLVAEIQKYNESTKKWEVLETVEDTDKALQDATHRVSQRQANGETGFRIVGAGA